MALQVIHHDPDRVKVIAGPAQARRTKGPKSGRKPASVTAEFTAHFYCRGKMDLWLCQLREQLEVLWVEEVTPSEESFRYAARVRARYMAVGAVPSSLVKAIQNIYALRSPDGSALYEFRWVFGQFKFFAAPGGAA